VVLVAPFEDLTGDPSLGTVGRVVADAVGQGLVETGLVRVVAPTGPVAAGGSDEALRAAARGAGAGLMVAGTVYLADGRLELRSRLVDTATGKLVYALEPASGPRGETAAIVDAAAQRVMGAVSVHLDPPLGLGPVVRPPPFRALREYRAGMSGSGGNWVEASRHFERAAELAPDFRGAQLRLIMAYQALGEKEKQEELRSRLRESSGELSPFEKLLFDLYEARVEKRNADALRILRILRTQAPDDLFFRVLTATLAARELDLDEVVRCLGDLDDADWDVLNQGPQGEWVFRMLTRAYHYRGDHERELAVADRSLLANPQSQEAIAQKVRALAALGRVAEVDRIVAVSQQTASGVVWSAGEVALAASEELRAHGSPDEARRIAANAAEWYAAQPGAEGETDLSRWNRMECLWMAERWDEAAPLADAFAARRLASDYVVHAKGLQGALAARRGDDAGARAADRDLEAVAEGRDLGDALYWRAVIAAQLDDRDAAVERLRSALAHGFVHPDWIHTYVFLEPVHGYPPFEALLEPQG
jgi:TolB-like protein/tetratricopeptide (TPR) repeat protein